MNNPTLTTKQKIYIIRNGEKNTTIQLAAQLQVAHSLVEEYVRDTGLKVQYDMEYMRSRNNNLSDYSHNFLRDKKNEKYE